MGRRGDYNVAIFKIDRFRALCYTLGTHPRSEFVITYFVIRKIAVLNFKNSLLADIALFKCPVNTYPRQSRLTVNKVIIFIGKGLLIKQSGNFDLFVIGLLDIGVPFRYHITYLQNGAEKQSKRENTGKNNYRTA